MNDICASSTFADRPVALALLLACIAPARACARGGADHRHPARNGFVIDFDTGAVLLDKDADERIPPASMSKMMTAYVVFD